MKLTKGMKKALSLLLSAAMVVTGVNVTTNTASAEDAATEHVINVVGAENGTLGAVTLDGSADNIANDDEAVLKVYLNTWDKDDDGKVRNSTCIHPTATVRADVEKYANPTVEVTSISDEKKITIYSSMDSWDSDIQGTQLGKGDKVSLADVVACDEWAKGDNGVLQFSVPSGVSATIKLYDAPAVKDLPLAEEDGYKAYLKFNDSTWSGFNSNSDEPDGTSAVITDNGTYTVSIDKNDYPDADPVEDVCVFNVDIVGLAAAQNLDSSEATIKDVIVKCDGRKIAMDSSHVYYGDIEGKGNLRLELRNEWGYGNGEFATKEDPGFDQDNFKFSESLSVTFTIEGLKAGSTPKGAWFREDGETSIVKTATGVCEADPEPTVAPTEVPTKAPAAASATPSAKAPTASAITTKPAISTQSALGTAKIAPKQKTVVVAPGKSVKVAFTATAAKNTSGAAVVTASTASKKVATAKVNGKKVVIKAPKKAVKGASTTVTLKSTNGDKKVSAKIKVYVRNSAKKVKAAKKAITVKKGKTTKLVIKASKVQNKKKAFADTITVKGNVLKLTNVKYAKGKATLTLKGAKKAKKKAVTIKVGKKSVKVKATVK